MTWRISISIAVQLSALHRIRTAVVIDGSVRRVDK
jgi:hypothetical protein